MPNLLPLALLAAVAAAMPSTAAAAQAAVSGQTLATTGDGTGAAPCASCHGAHGEGNPAAGFPRLAGLDADYLAKQLHDFKEKSRESPVMQPIAAALTDAEIKAASTYYAKLPAPAAQTAAQGDAALGAHLAAWGDWPERGLPACSQCHGEEGRGVGDSFPALSGQVASYIEAQLKAWKAGSRHNDPLGLMKTVASKLSDEEMKAVAAYYAAGAKAEPSAKLTAAAAADGKPDKHFTPPPRSAMPTGPFGDAVRRGEAIFTHTDTDELASQYVGNALQCENCHIDAGRMADSSPMWAAYVSYPAYRSKNKKVNTMIMRLQGCFNYSMNAPASKKGAPPSAESEVMVDLMSYLYWLASGAPTGDSKIEGRGYPDLKPTSAGFDPGRGSKVYAQKCSVCHGANGQGQFEQGRAVFPPLWGAKSYNWGAGMHGVDKAAAFIKANMPLGLSGSLSEQEAWDVAAFVNSHERPQDPRFKGNLEATRKAYHAGKFDYYGSYKTPQGKLLGAAAPSGKAK